MKKLKLNEGEGLELLKAWVAISLAFAIVLNENIFSSSFFLTLLLAGLTVGIGFLAHELAHKIIAQRYGCYAEFKSFNGMLVLAVLMSFFGFVFAAPGAVFINGYVNIEKNGKISLSGPLTNLILAALFFILGITISTGFWAQVFGYGFMINSWLALFNMIPIWNLDGTKILRWNKTVYFSMIIICIGFLIVGMI
mgnify:FL=1